MMAFTRAYSSHCVSLLLLLLLCSVVLAQRAPKGIVFQGKELGNGAIRVMESKSGKPVGCMDSFGQLVIPFDVEEPCFESFRLAAKTEDAQNMDNRWFLLQTIGSDRFCGFKKERPADMGRSKRVDVIDCKREHPGRGQWIVMPGFNDKEARQPFAFTEDQTVHADLYATRPGRVGDAAKFYANPIPGQGMEPFTLKWVPAGREEHLRKPLLLPMPMPMDRPRGSRKIF